MIETKGRSCKGKRGYPTSTAADTQRRDLIARGGVRLATYRCRHCKRWHVGHLPKPRRTR
ncbi:hypothetical protein [Actinopolymorpha alba]|uniref:hypothetical protein n=1 Tax=Actinopolymorpha alba TaxID=533267 RepID=UPI0012F6A2E8|nr:hypothetical protein [Actinopolymorpha alba]